MDPLLDLSGGRLDLVVVRGVASEYNLGVFANDVLVSLAASTWTCNIATAAAPTTAVTSFTVTTPSTGIINLKLTSTNANLLTAGTKYVMMLVQIPTDGSGPYPIASGDITVRNKT